MKLVKLVNVYTQSTTGNKEQHYGHMCEIRKDGVYCELEDGLADLFAADGRAKIVEDVKPVEVVIPQLQVVETATVEVEETTVETGFVEPETPAIPEVATESEAPDEFAAMVAAFNAEPETITSKTQGKRGPKAKAA